MKLVLIFELCQVFCLLLKIVIPPRDQMDNKTIKEVILHDKECPLSICLNHAQKNEGLTKKLRIRQNIILV